MDDFKNILSKNQKSKDNLVVFYYLCVSEIWLFLRGTIYIAHGQYYVAKITVL